MTNKRELFTTWVAFGVTAVASAMVMVDGVRLLLARAARGDTGGVVEQAVFLLLCAGILYGSFVYLLCRRGWLIRTAAHRPATRADLDAFVVDAPPVVFLLPSYKEDAEVVRQAILSCALQEYPDRRVTLLVDDPPAPTTLADRAGLEASRALPGRIQSLLQQEAGRYRAARAAFEERRSTSALDLGAERELLARLHEDAARWFEEQAAAHPGKAHTDRLFVEKVLLERAVVHRDRAARLRDVDVVLEAADLVRDHALLASRFDVKISSFERKRYANLSHEPNKAMNLNSYLELLGKHFREQRRPDGVHLVRTHDPAEATLSLPDPAYVVTLDADSVLLPDYAARLVQIMERPGNERLAVAQTPYSAVPDPTSLVERVAGATTDMQFLIHQGFTQYDATFWVGANAVLRKIALDEIRTEEVDARGLRVAKFIQDRTVIEDTESTIDLALRGWTLHNYPERLSYSATPPDFGALLIQRRRWANGGLLILPRLLELLARDPFGRGVLAMAFMRFHYLVSLALVNVGYVAFLLWPFEGATTPWLPVSALPYFVLYGRDLLHCGYRVGDLFRVYAVNIMLVAVHLGGVVKSVEQAITGQQLPFQRTPKVEGRTAAPAIYVAMQLVLLAGCVVMSALNLAMDNLFLATFSLLNAGVFVYVIVSFMGIRACAEDLWLGLAPLRALLPAPRVVAPVVVTEARPPVAAHRRAA